MSDETNDVKITIQSDKPIEFDLLMDSKTTRGLTTPYELVVTETDSKMIFKSRHENSVLKIKVQRKKTVLTSDWPITVLLIEKDKLSSFGIY